jgi:hypothetical protein
VGHHPSVCGGEQPVDACGGLASAVASRSARAASLRKMRTSLAWPGSCPAPGHLLVGRIDDIVLKREQHPLQFTFRPHGCGPRSPSRSSARRIRLLASWSRSLQSISGGRPRACRRAITFRRNRSILVTSSRASARAAEVFSRKTSKASGWRIVFRSSLTPPMRCFAMCADNSRKIIFPRLRARAGGA